MKTFIVGVLLFSFFFSTGILLARHKPLWNDELYGQTTIQRTSWPDIILGHTHEWNNFPMYFALQKGFLQLFHYQLPFVWQGEGRVVDPQAQLVLRILPDFLMSIALTAIVLFFGFRSGFAAGALALFISLSMPMVWLYWVEARPYSLWFALTVFQSLLFLDTASNKSINARTIPFLLVQAGLCLTVPLGLIQTIVCQGLLWRFGIRRIKFHIAAALVPVFLCSYYMMLQPKMSLYLMVAWQTIFLRNFPTEEITFLGLYAMLMLLSLREASFRKYFMLGRIFFPFCVAFLGIALAGLFYAQWKSTSQSGPVVERHFIFLTPMAIIMTVAIFADLWRAAAQRPWWGFVLLVIFAAGLTGQSLSTFEVVDHFYVYC